MAFCLLFEATSIHEYLAAGNKLRQIVGASEAIESLCGPTLDSTLSALPHGAELAFSRRAGGVFVAFCDRQAPLEDLGRAWSLIVREKLPGLAFKLALGHGSTRLEAAENARHQAEGTRPASARWLPSATPFSARQASTGLPAVVLKGEELLDAASRAKLDAAKTDTNALGSRFLPGSTWRDWPLDLSADSESELAFPFLHREQSLALLVADGNGLGQRLQHLHRRVAGSSDDAYLSTLRTFSDQLEGATRAAAQHAVAEVAVPARQAKQPNAPLPLRPVLLGGDDLVVIIRADLALPFARSFMAAFERETSARIPRLEDEPPLTASVGMVFFGRRQPIAQVQSLAYGLMKQVAKSKVKEALPTGHAVPAAISWHRLTAAEIGDIDAVTSYDWTFQSQDGAVRVAGLPYLNAAPAGPLDLAGLDSLLALVQLLKDHNNVRSMLRQVLGLMATDVSAATFRYRRWWEVSEQRDHGLAEQLASVAGTLFGGRLNAHPELPLLFRDERSGQWVSPIGDALALIDAMATEASA